MKRGKFSNKFADLTALDISSLLKIKEEDNLLGKIKRLLRKKPELEPVGKAFNWVLKSQTDFKTSLIFCLIGDKSYRKYIFKYLDKARDQYLIYMTKVYEFDTVDDFKVWIKRNLHIKEFLTTNGDLIYILGTKYKAQLATW